MSTSNQHPPSPFNLESREVSSDEFESLKLVRASVQAVSLMANKMLKDLETITKNYEAIAELNERWRPFLEGNNR
ncbi:uncharacterized protein VTP21DRAFT_11202 [Calcarisporiella thermophila]|uniref:uncharacterized protein n=1 Tax=Calcarisporiella thermophila TaxID=911321 RepID=UPI0037438F30